MLITTRISDKRYDAGSRSAPEYDLPISRYADFEISTFYAVFGDFLRYLTIFRNIRKIHKMLQKSYIRK